MRRHAWLRSLMLVGLVLSGRQAAAAPVVIGEFGWMGDDVFGFTPFVNAFTPDWPAGLELVGVSISVDGTDVFASYVESGGACVGQGATVGATTSLQFPGVNPDPSSGCNLFDPFSPFEEATLNFALNDPLLGVLTVAALDGPLRLPGEFLAAVPLLFEARQPPPPTPVSEPATIALLGAGLVAAGRRLRRGRRLRSWREGRGMRPLGGPQPSRS
jgi:hypothetical protein